MLEDIRPTRKELVFDLAEEAGLDTQDWIESSSQPQAFKANPKYCYQWSFVEPGQLVILNLWFATMVEEDGRILQRNNFRLDAQLNAGNSTWVRRATLIDEALQTAVRDDLIVRVIIIDGEMREKGNPTAEASKVSKRQLDPEFWTIAEYDWETGENTIVRGLIDAKYVDQFDVQDPRKPERQISTRTDHKRDRTIRQAALARANGKCELCNEAGFLMHNGKLYLETHHIVPLSEGGSDSIGNVIALCPNDHRKAHFSKDRSDIRAQMLAIVS